MWSDLFSDSGVLVTQDKWDRVKVRIILQNVLYCRCHMVAF